MKTSTVLFKTDFDNLYFYDFKKNQVLYCHPVFRYFLSMMERGIDVKNRFDKLDTGTVNLKKYRLSSKKELDYYYKKFLVLLENGYFAPVNRAHRLSGRINADTVKQALAGTNAVIFESTESCNLKCGYCAYGKLYERGDKRTNGNLSVGTGQKVLEYFTTLWNSPLNISHHKTVNISFFGGEPLLNFNFIKEIVAFAKKLKLLHNRLVFSMTSNALLLEKYMDFLVENEFELLISLDGNEKNNRYRVFKNGKPSFKTVLKNIKAFKNKYPGYFAKKVNFNAVLHNKNSVSDIHRYIKDTFDKIPRISQLSPIGIKPSRKEEFKKTYANLRESLHQSEDYALFEKEMHTRAPGIKETRDFIHQYSGYLYRDYNRLLYPGGESKKRLPSATCFPFKSKVFVTARGKLLPCERIAHQFALGFANEERVALDFEKIAEIYNTLYDKIRERCVHCYNSELCMQCMFYFNIEEETPECRGFMDRADFSEYLSARMSYIEKNPGIYPEMMEAGDG